jgi:glucan phosphoethanolaminetransferase (alkaline phosphatase superfamily)
MIQRIQSLFLLGVVIISALMYFFNVANFFTEFAYYKLYLHGLENMTPGGEEVFSKTFTLPLLIINVLAGLMALLTIFYYKRRMLQVRLIRFIFLLEIVLVALVFFYYIPTIEEALNANADYMGIVGIYLPLGSLLLLILANRFIMRDEKLVRAANRLR